MYALIECSFKGKYSVRVMTDEIYRRKICKTSETRVNLQPYLTTCDILNNAIRELVVVFIINIAMFRFKLNIK